MRRAELTEPTSQQGERTRGEGRSRSEFALGAGQEMHSHALMCDVTSFQTKERPQQHPGSTTQDAKM